MNPILITVAVATALLAVLAVLALRQGSQMTGLQDLDSRWQAVDMQAFLNLADESEERYLRQNLTSSEFRAIQRMRVRVMWEYLGRLAFNSKLMMQAGQIVQHHSSGKQLQEATELVATASRMRLTIFAADVVLATRFVFPHTHDPVRALASKYEALTASFTQTCGSQLAAAGSMAS